jgi:hypothetical protein
MKLKINNGKINPGDKIKITSRITGDKTHEIIFCDVVYKYVYPGEHDYIYIFKNDYMVLLYRSGNVMNKEDFSELTINDFQGIEWNVLDSILNSDILGLIREDKINDVLNGNN